VAAKILVFILLVASYDLLLGYTGIVSFAHTMFFGIGAYGVAIASTRLGEGWDGAGCGRGLRAGGVAGAVAGDRAVLAAGEGHLLRDDHARRGVGLPDPGLAAERRHRRRGRPQLQEPGGAQPVVRAVRRAGAGPHLDGKVLSLLPALRGGGAGLLALLRIVNSPFGRVLQAIRENDFRAEAIGYRTVVYRT
jgi:branched-chain amino acid transport system permease protein